MEASPLRIVLLGKTGAGKSSFGNTLLGTDEFQVNCSASSGTSECKWASGGLDGTPLCVLDTPGFFDSRKPDDELRADIVRAIVECSPGHHAFFIFLKVEKHTVHEKKVVSRIIQTFSEEALRYAVLVFTHGDQLADHTTIQEFVSENQDLRELCDRCGSRCHVVDNKYWKGDLQDPYRNNQVQLRRLLDTVKGMVAGNPGSCYTSQMLQEVGRRIQQEEMLRLSAPRTPPQESSRQARNAVFYNLLKMTVGISTGALMGALLGVSGERSLLMKSLLAGGIIGYEEASRADSVSEAVTNTAAAVGGAAENAASNLNAAITAEKK